MGTGLTFIGGDLYVSDSYSAGDTLPARLRAAAKRSRSNCRLLTEAANRIENHSEE